MIELLGYWRLSHAVPVNDPAAALHLTLAATVPPELPGLLRSGLVDLQILAPQIEAKGGHLHERGVSDVVAASWPLPAGGLAVTALDLAPDEAAIGTLAEVVRAVVALKWFICRPTRTGFVRLL